MSTVQRTPDRQIRESAASELEERLRNPRPGEPVWPLAAILLPRQGDWTEERYLALDTTRLVEYVNGYLDFLPIPTKPHQLILGFLYRVIQSFIDGRRNGLTFIAGYKVKIAAEAYREPDVVCVLKHHLTSAGHQFTESADLVVEVVSPNDPDHDWVTKKSEYAAAGIPEYWIADPRDNTLTIFTLDDGATEYRQAGRYKQGDTATSVLLDGLTVEVADVFRGEGV